MQLKHSTFFLSNRWPNNETCHIRIQSAEFCRPRQLFSGNLPHNGMKQIDKLLTAVLTLFCCALNAQSPEYPVPYRKDTLWGFADQQRQLVIPAQYLYASTFKQMPNNGPSYAAVSSKDSTWLIDKRGRPFFVGMPRQDHFFLTLIGHNHLLETPTGTCYLDSTLQLQYFYENLQVFKPHHFVSSNIPAIRKYLEWKDSKKTKSINGRNFVKSVCSWDQTNMVDQRVTFDTQKKTYGIIGNDGEILADAIYPRISNMYKNRIVTAHAIINVKRKKEIKTPYFLTSNFCRDGLVQAKDTTTGLIGYMDYEGDMVIPPRYRTAFGFYRRLALCQLQDHTWELINKDGQPLLKVFPDTTQQVFGVPYVYPTDQDSIYTKHGLVYTEQFLFVRQSDGFWHCYNWNIEKQAMPPLDGPPSPARYRGNKVFLGKRDSLIFLMDNHWTIVAQSIPGNNRYLAQSLFPETSIVPLIYKGRIRISSSSIKHNIDDIAEFHRNSRNQQRALFSRNGLVGLIDSIGTVLVKPKYQLLQPCGIDQYLAKKDNLYGLIDETDNIKLAFSDNPDLMELLPKEGDFNHELFIPIIDTLSPEMVSKLSSERLPYFQDSTYRQWDVPLYGKYQLPRNDSESNSIGDYRTFSILYSRDEYHRFIYAQGIFHKDGSCILPAKCSRKITAYPKLHCYQVEEKGEKLWFDPQNGRFLRGASSFIPYYKEKAPMGPAPEGFFWVEKNSQWGLVRLVDGVPFFRE